MKKRISIDEYTLKWVSGFLDKPVEELKKDIDVANELPTVTAKEAKEHTDKHWQAVANAFDMEAK